jgi:hypothetical protein
VSGFTPEQEVASAVASTELDGGTIDPEWRKVLLRVADGSLSSDDAVRAAVEDARHELIALAWHDVTCAEAQECRDRRLHSQDSALVTSGLLGRFLARLADTTSDGT